MLQPSAWFNVLKLGQPRRRAKFVITQPQRWSLILDPTPSNKSTLGPNRPEVGNGSSFHHYHQPRATILHAGFTQATTHVLAELFNHQTLVVVTGGPGLGKTMLLLEVARVLQAAGWHIARETTFEVASSWQAASARPAPGPIALLIDGPGKITPPEIQSLLRVQNLAIVLALPDDGPWRFPSCAPVRLAPMTPDASAQFLRTWLRQAGTPPDLLSAEAMTRAAELSQGVPRLLSSLMQKLAHQSVPSPGPLSPADVDAAAQSLHLPLDPITVTTTAAAKAMTQRDAELLAELRLADAQPPHLSLQHPGPDGDQPRDLRSFLPANPGSAALTGLLLGVATAILGLLLQDLLLSSREDKRNNQAEHEISAPSTLPGPATPGPR